MAIAPNAKKPVKPTQSPRATPTARSLARRALNPLALLCLLLLPYFAVFLAIRVQPAAEQFHRFQPFFLTTDFFRAFLVRPGGPVEYATAFLHHVAVSNWAASVLLAAVCGLGALLTSLLGKRLEQDFAPPASMVPLTLPALAAVSNLGQGLQLGLGYIMATAAIWGLIAWCGRMSGGRLMTGFTLALLVTYLGGWWAGSLFACWAALDSFGRNERVAALGWAALGIGATIPGGWATGNQWPEGVWLGIILHLLPPLICALGTLLSTRTPRRRWPRLVAPWLAVVMATGGGIAAWLSHDDLGAIRARIDFLAHQEAWSEVLREADQLPAVDISSEIRRQLALYEQGSLLDRLFTFTNQVVWNLLPGLDEGVDACRAQSQTLFRLGHVGIAEHFAHEALEWEGERPDVLRLLASINILKERPKAAQVFLNVLAQMPAQRAGARQWLRELEADPAGTKNPELSRVRPLIPRTDLPHDDLPTEPSLRQLLHANPSNRMALQYLLAHYLLQLDLKGVTDNLGRLRQQGWTQLPRHLQEAILLREKTDSVQIDCLGWGLSPEIEQRFRRLTEALERGDHLTPTGRHRLTAEFGDTFWHYYLVRQTAARPNS